MSKKKSKMGKKNKKKEGSRPINLNVSPQIVVYLYMYRPVWSIGSGVRAVTSVSECIYIPPRKPAACMHII